MVISVNDFVIYLNNTQSPIEVPVIAAEKYQDVTQMETLVPDQSYTKSRGLGGLQKNINNAPIKAQPQAISNASP
jgi:hypothetical protein